MFDRSIPAWKPRYVPAVVEMEGGSWKAMVVLCESEYHEEIEQDSAMVAWCEHFHRTAETAERCRQMKRMERLAQKMNQDVKEVPL